FLNVLFEPGEQTCFADTIKGTAVSLHPKHDDEFFSINALYSNRDENPIEPWHSENKPRRADHNVASFRNFLIELDNMPLAEQIDYVTKRIPVTSIVYSGGKSYHFIVSLEQALANAEQYLEVARRIQLAVPACDRACKNPSRLSRLPGAIRKDTDRVQDLVALGSRIPVAALLDKL